MVERAQPAVRRRAGRRSLTHARRAPALLAAARPMPPMAGQVCCGRAISCARARMQSQARARERRADAHLHLDEGAAGRLQGHGRRERERAGGEREHLGLGVVDGAEAAQEF